MGDYYLLPTTAKLMLYSRELMELWVGCLIMQDCIARVLKGHGAQYAEIRLEQSESTNLRYRGKDLEEIGRNSGIGGNVRALAGGGWGFTCFNDMSNLQENVATAVSHARHIGGPQVFLAELDPHVDIVHSVSPCTPQDISPSRKKRILDECVEIMLSVNGVQSCSIRI